MRKENLNEILQESYNNTKVKYDEAQEKIKNADKLLKDYQEVKDANKELQKSVGDMKKQIEQMGDEHEKVIANMQQLEIDAVEKITAEMTLKLEKAVFAENVRAEKAMQELKKEKQQEIDEYQKKYLELLERLQNGTVEDGK